MTGMMPTEDAGYRDSATHEPVRLVSGNAETFCSSRGVTKKDISKVASPRADDDCQTSSEILGSAPSRARP